MPSLSHARLAFLPLVALAAACGEPAAPPATGAPEVDIVTLTSQPVRLTRELPGRTRAFLVAEVRPQVDGIVEEQLFEEGSVVEAGQPLYQLDDDMYRADHESAQAALARAEASLEVARLNAERTSELIRTNAISEQERENAVAAFNQAQADVGVARAAVRSSAVRLGYARITAPISGRIGKSSVTPGALVTANQEEPLATVQQFDPMFVDLSQSATELLALRRELATGRLATAADVPVTIVLEGGQPYEHTGTLKFADLAVDPSTGSFSSRIVVPNPDHMLLPGMYVRAVISPAVIQNGVLVPQRGITRDPTGSAVAMVIVGEDNTVERRTVEVSRTIGDQWLVDAGLAAGDRVVVAGLQKIQPGMQVRVNEAAERPSAEASLSQPTETAVRGDRAHR